jgi:N,N'-diacetyllegionaminate synthase
MPAVDIGGRPVGQGHPCFVIAEAGVNHNGDLELARELVRIAARTGADAIKFQTFSADRLVTASAAKAEYQVDRTGSDESQHDMLKRLELSADDHRRLMADCKGEGILFLSSAFDEASADLLDELGVVAYKVPSGEITNLPYLRHLATKGRPLIVSTGMSTMDEVSAAMAAIQATREVPVVLLHCVSLYPSPPEAANLHAMAAMRAEFDVPVGYSDHTEGIWISLAAVALGANMIEKHLTKDRGLAGPDHEASLEPAAFSSMMEGIREVEASLGDGVKRPLPEEAATAAAARKSVVAATNIPAGTAIRRDMLAVMRPGTGLPPDRLDWVVGRKARRPIASGSAITAEMV